MLPGLAEAEDSRDWHDCFERDYSMFPPYLTKFYDDDEYEEEKDFEEDEE